MFVKFQVHLLISFAAAILISCTTSRTIPVHTPEAAYTDITSQVPVPVDTARTDMFLDSILKQYPQYFDAVLYNKKDWNVQLIYTQVDRGANGMAALKQYSFNLDADRYFYPASTVKLPVSILALQKLNELNIPGLDKNTTMITEQAYSGQTAVYNDPTTFTGKPTIANYIKKILMVSDNDAFNRLYEFLGQEYINSRLNNMGYSNVQLLHRLDISLTADENRHTNPVRFFDNNQRPIYEQPMQNNTTAYKERQDSIGLEYYKDTLLVPGPMDFSKKNRISLQDLHTILISLVFPAKVPASQRFNLTEEDRSFLLKYMSQLPVESTYPPYSADSAAYWPAYCKFLLYGSEKREIPKNIRIFNKVGDAYGQLTDVAYIVDYDKKIEFFLSATIYCNSDGIMNDNKYSYDEIGFPFMKHLGEVLYDYEVKRKRNITPDLSGFIFNYDKED